MKEIIKPGVSLLLITLIAAACLGLVYGITKEPIEREQERARVLAMHEVLPAAEEYKTEVDISEEYESIKSVFTGYKSDKTLVGYVISVSSKGYGGYIDMMVGIDDMGAVQGISIIKHNETPGLGANADTETFKNKYIDKLGPITVTKDVPGDNEIDAITSATITSRAVTDGVNDALSFVNDYIKGGKR